MAVTPPQIPLDYARAMLVHHDAEEKDDVSIAVSDAAERGIPIRIIRRAVRSPDAGTLAFIDAHPDVALLLTGWKGSLSSSHIYGSPTKNILEKAPCDVAVLLPRGFSKARRILVPIGGGPHARMGLRLALQFARGEGSELTALRVLRPDDSLDMDVEMEGLKRVLTDVLNEDATEVSPRLVVAEDVIEAILAAAREGEYDLLVIGASDEWQIKSLLAGSLPDAVADRSSCSVLLVRRYEPVGVSTTRRILASLRGWK